MSNKNVPEILKQKFTELNNTSRNLIPTYTITTTKDSKPSESFDKGKFLLWKGVETGLFFLTGSVTPGSLYIYDYKNGTENAELILDYKFGRTAIIIDVIYFPLVDDLPGIIVAVTDQALEARGNYLAYISLKTKSLIKAFFLPYPITTLCSILDGTATPDEFTRLAPSFHKDWDHILLVGCRLGYVSLVCLDLSPSDDRLSVSVEYLQNVTESPSGSTSKRRFTDETVVRPIRPKRSVHLSKIFYDDQMFVFRADDGITRCTQKEKVYVSALHWLDKSGLAIVGFNFGGIMIVSLRTSKVFSLLYIDGSVQNFAVQEPQDDPRPILYFWIAYNSYSIGTTLLMCTITFPKDEEATKNSEEYTYLEPVFAPSMKWSPDNCTAMTTMRTIYMSKRSQESNDDWNDGRKNPTSSEKGKNQLPKDDSSLLLISWLERNKRGETIHGALFDLNAFYAKRLVPRIQPDSTIARQFPFLAKFSSTLLNKQTDSPLDISASNISHFAIPAFLNETIDQLYYPSTYHIDAVCLTSTRVFQAKVQPIQVQLITNLAQNINKYFESPHDPARWIHAIGLANSAPSDNINEERACLLRLIVHSFFPSMISLIDSTSQNMEWLKFIQKWVWKEVEITKTKFDDLCSPLFANPPYEPSPSARAYIQHARVFFKRASIIFEELIKKFEHEKSKSMSVQAKAARQVRLYSTGVSFALVYNLLPVNKLNEQLYDAVIDQFSKRLEVARRTKKTMQIHSLLEQIIKANPDDEIWQGKTEMEWYPPRDFKCFLPILLMANITDSAKLALIGYYCQDLEEASLATFASDVEVKDGNTPPSSLARRSSSSDNNLQPFRSQKYFSIFLSYSLQEDFSLEQMNQIRAIWIEDKRILEIQRDDQFETTNQNKQIANGTEDNDQIKWLLDSPGKIKQCQESYLKMEWGIFKFNELMLERKLYKFLLDLPPLEGNEPKFVQECHARCLDIKRRYSSLFTKLSPLPTFIMERYKNKVRQQMGHNDFALSINSEQSQNQPVLPLNIKHRASLLEEMKTQSLHSTRQQVNGPSTSSPAFSNSDEKSDYEELPLTIATPKKRERIALFESSLPTRETMNEGIMERLTSPPWTTLNDNGASTKDVGKSPIMCNVLEQGLIEGKKWERVSKVTETPLSLRKSISQSRLPIRQPRQFTRDRARASLFPSRRAASETVVAQPLTADNMIMDTTPPTGPRNILEVDQISPEPNTTRPVQPPSILKTDKTRSRLPSQTNSDKPKLRFAQSLFTTEQIPSRTERLHDTSFSNFANLSPSESPTSSASTFQTGCGNSTNLGSTEASIVALSEPPSAMNKAHTQIRQFESTIGPGGVPILSFDGPDKAKDMPINDVNTNEVQKEIEHKANDQQFIESFEVQDEPEDILANAENEEEVVNLNEKDENKIIESAATNDEPQQEAAKTTTKLTSTVAILESRDSRHNKVANKQISPKTSTTTAWLMSNMRQGPILRRSTRARRTTEHFEPEPASPRQSPSRFDKEKTPNQEKTPPPAQTPPSSRKRGRPSSVQRETTPKISTTPTNTPRKRGRPSTRKEEKDAQQ